MAANDVMLAMAAFANAPYLSKAERLVEQKYAEYGAISVKLVI